MDPLITNGIDPALLRVLEKRGDQRDAVPRRKRTVVPDEAIEQIDDKDNRDAETDSPKHALDDLA